MTSQDRKEVRYQRRQAKRQAKKVERNDAVGDLATVFNYGDMFRAGQKCCNGVRWKHSVQNFELHLFSGTAKRRRQLLNGTWKPGNYVHFTLTERGKSRPIDAPHITDRQVHKTLCKNALIPLYTPSMIYDNGASMPGKGLHFAYNRLEDQLRHHYRKNGRNGCIVLMDFSKFFPSAPHGTLFDRHKALILDERVRAIADAVVAASPHGEGMPLGVEPSQIEMVAAPSSLDNFLKCQLSIRGAAHYMDDYYIILPDREMGQMVKDAFAAMAEEMGFTINRSKSKVVDLTKPFKFCKATFHLTETGAVIRRGSRDGMKRARRKLNGFKPKVDTGKMTIKEVEEYLTSQIAYYKGYDDHGRVLKLLRMFCAIYIKKGGNGYGIYLQEENEGLGNLRDGEHSVWDSPPCGGQLLALSG